MHRMLNWFPGIWSKNPPRDRIAEIVAWEHDTLNPKYGINYGLEYTRTLGVAQIADYEQFFPSFSLKLLDKPLAQDLGIGLGEDVYYHARRAYDLWNTRYVIVPFDPNGWGDPLRGFASFMFRSRQVYPDRDRFMGPEGAEQTKNWAETRDFMVIRNLLAYPRAWIVHAARDTSPHGIFRGGPERYCVRDHLRA